MDAGALIGWQRGTFRARKLIAEATATAGCIVPASALAQSWRGGPRDALLARLMRTALLDPLDGPMARAVGTLCARSETTDIADAHVVICARRHGGVVATTDPDDLLALDPELFVIAL